MTLSEWERRGIYEEEKARIEADRRRDLDEYSARSRESLANIKWVEADGWLIDPSANTVQPIRVKHFKGNTKDIFPADDSILVPTHKHLFITRESAISEVVLRLKKRREKLDSELTEISRKLEAWASESNKLTMDLRSY